MVAYFCVFEIEFKYRWFKCVIMYMCLCENYVCSIVHACGLSWPSDRVIIQVLDDSTDPIIKVEIIPSY